MKKALTLLLFLALALPACKEKEPDIDVTAVRLSASEIHLAVGETRTLTAQTVPSNATDQSFSWSSSEPSVAGVSQSGLVTALSAGEADITVAASGGVTAFCRVFVTDAPVKVTGVTLSEDEISVLEGQTVSLTATVLPENATNKALRWDCDKVNVAVVLDGVIKGLSAGNAKITVTTVDGGFQATCRLTVKEDKNIIEEGGTAEGFNEITDTYGWN